MVCEILVSLDGGIFLNVSGIVVNRILRNIKPGSEYTFLKVVTENVGYTKLYVGVLIIYG